MAKIETVVCDTKGCLTLAEGACVICSRDACAAHLAAPLDSWVSACLTTRGDVKTLARVCTECRNMFNNVVISNAIQPFLTEALVKSIEQLQTLWSAARLGAPPAEKPRVPHNDKSDRYK